MSSFFSRLFWGSPSEESSKEESGPMVTTEEGSEGWLLVNRARESGSTSSAGQQDWDMESMASDGSWVLTPAFTTGSPFPATPHPMEDELIEGPAGVYQQPAEGAEQEHEQTNNELEQAQQLKREMVLRSRHRREVAHHLQIPVRPERRVWPRRTRVERQQLTRRALNKQNMNSTHKHKGGVKQVNKVHKVPMKATGKRRC